MLLVSILYLLLRCIIWCLKFLLKKSDELYWKWTDFSPMDGITQLLFDRPQQEWARGRQRGQRIPWLIGKSPVSVKRLASSPKVPGGFPFKFVRDIQYPKPSFMEMENFVPRQVSGLRIRCGMDSCCSSSLGSCHPVMQCMLDPNNHLLP